VASDPSLIWQSAVKQGAQGYYLDAALLCEQLLAWDGRWRSLALSTRASHCRQIGDIDSAQSGDEAARECAADDESRADALIGLAADAVARGDVVTAAVFHAQAASVAHDWRTRTRWHWVGAEHALLIGDSRAARDHALAAAASCSAWSPRHHAKSRIILAAASADASYLTDTAVLIEESGWATLEWPLALVAADHADQVDSDWRAAAWDRGVAATLLIEEHLPQDLAAIWRRHPGVRRLRAGDPVSGGR
jgi:hypothetical protein